MEMLSPDGAVLHSVDNSSVPEVYGAVNTSSPSLNYIIVGRKAVSGQGMLTA